MILFQELGKHLENVKSWNPQQAKTEEMFSYIDLSSVDKDRKAVDLNQIQQVISVDAPSRARQIVKKSDILVSTVRPNLNGVALVPDALDKATASTGYCVLRANEKTLNAQYLFYWVQTKSFINEMVSKATGANYPAISDKIIKQSKIPLPPLAEQQKIAVILAAADSLRQKDQQLVERYTALSQSLFLEMFGDPVTNPMGWKKSRIDALCTIVRGSSPRPKGDPRYYGGEVPRLMVADLTRDGKNVTPKIDFLTAEGAKKSRPIKAGTVVMAVSGNVGLTSILTVNACVHDGFIAFNKLHSDKILPEFFVDLMMFLKSTHASRQAGAIFKNLTTSQIKEMEIPLPAIELQIEFNKKLKSIEEQKQQAQRSLEKSEGLFNSLLQRAFTGELTAKMAA